MLSLVVGTVLAVSPPVLPDEPAPAVAEGPVEGPAPAPEPAEEAFVVAPAPAPAPVVETTVVVVPPTLPPSTEVRRDTFFAPRRGPVVPAPPWSGTGRFVGGSVMLIAGTGLLTAATLEYADGRDSTQPVISQVPAGVSMLIAGGVMIGTGVRDQHRLGEWEAATKIDAHPTGNGLIIAGVTGTALGSMAAIATAIASDMDLDAPRSIPAGWATAGVAIGTGTALLIAGIVRRNRYGDWRDRVTGTPMVVPVRAGAAVGLHTQF